MRVPSSRGIRGLSCGGRGCLFLLLICALLGTREAGAQAITRFTRDAGHINFVTTGGSLRNSPNTGSPCNLNGTSTQTLSGIPATAHRFARPTSTGARRATPLTPASR